MAYPNWSKCSKLALGRYPRLDVDHVVPAKFEFAADKADCGVPEHCAYAKSGNEDDWRVDLPYHPKRTARVHVGSGPRQNSISIGPPASI